ncbi:unnamed protein product [Caenorhabditis angaria]|uniref:DUF7596 domain-containing protein n=1 Tax=Caenorhabditis angaria TaxID=860376 RepID=A0A9P1J2N7_9PELO|nr:unnamed protein product [Caenorhabditis angaria]
MLQSPSLVQIINKSIAYKNLGDALLPVNNNAEFMSSSNAVTVTVCGQNDDEPVAFGSIVRCSERQAYVMLGEVAEEYADKSVWVEKVENGEKLHHVFKITKSVPLIDYSGETHFEQTFGNRDEKPVHLHVLDSLIDNTVGLESLDVMKNVTVDFENNSNLDSWRDTVGFVVSDKFCYEKITVNRFELLSLADSESNVAVENVEKLETILDYDGEVSMFQRDEFLTTLYSTSGISCKVARIEGNVVGYIANTSSNILQCYGETEEVQRALFAAAAETMNPQVTLYVRKNANATIEKLSENALTHSNITRLNTRVVVNTIKWPKIGALNMGLHMF